MHEEDSPFPRSQLHTLGRTQRPLPQRRLHRAETLETRRPGQSDIFGQDQCEVYRNSSDGDPGPMGHLIQA